MSGNADDAAFERWIIDLRYEIDQVYSRFDLVPEHWRDDFDEGRRPAEAFERIVEMVVEAKRRKRLS